MKKNTHKHHIIPKHMGGTDDPDNLIELTVEDHAEEHKKLYEENGNFKDKIAWLALSGQIEKDEIRRKLTSEAVKDTIMITDGTITKRLKKYKNIPEGWNIKKIEISEEKKKYLSEINTGIPRPKDEIFKEKVKNTLIEYYKENPLPKGFGDGSAWLGRKHLSWKVDSVSGKRVWYNKQHINEENERIEKMNRG